MICNYGCGQEAKYQFKNGKRCCSDNWQRCPEIRKNKCGENHHFYGKHHSKNTKYKISKKAKERNPFTEEHRKKNIYSKFWKK